MGYIATFPETDITGEMTDEMKAETSAIKTYLDFLTKLQMEEAAAQVKQCWMSTTYDKGDKNCNTSADKSNFEGHQQIDERIHSINFMIMREMHGSKSKTSVKSGPPPAPGPERKV